MADIFKEVDEDLRRDQAAKIWQKYSTVIIGAVVVVVLAVAGYQGWKWWDLKTRSEQSTLYQAALEDLSQGEAGEAAIKLGEVQAGGGDYAILARFNEARLLSETGDLAGAVEIWTGLAQDSSAGPALQGAAHVLSIMHQLDSGDPASLEAELQPLLQPDNGYRAMALEMSAILALRRGDSERARSLYTEVVDDLTAPATLRGRAAQMLATLGG